MFVVDVAKVAVTIANSTSIWLRFDCDVVIKITICFPFDYDENEHVHFFVVSRGVISNKKAVVGAYNDVIVYITVIRMAFTLTDEHCRRWYNLFTHSRNKMSSGMNSCLH